MLSITGGPHVIKYRMPAYILRRLLMMAPILLGITVIIFIVIHLAPGDPVSSQTDMNMKAKASARENLRKLYGLDRPLHEQYWDWLKRTAKLDFGKSFVDGRNVRDKIFERVPITLGINVLSIALILFIAIPIGVMSAVKQSSLFDRISTVLVFVGYSMPSFWLALLLMILFGVYMAVLPISGIQSVGIEELGPMGRAWDIARHLVLPVSLSAFTGLAAMSRYSRSSMLEVVRQDYIRTARAKGLSEARVIIRHALRNALMPIVTLIGLMVPALIGGSVIFETIFAIPGMGKLFFESAMSRDYPTIMGVLFIGAMLTLIGNLTADVLYAIVDPRVRVKR